MTRRRSRALWGAWLIDSLNIREVTAKKGFQQRSFDTMLDTRYLLLHICQNLKTHHNYHCTLGAWPVAGQFSHFRVVAPRYGIWRIVYNILDLFIWKYHLWTRGWENIRVVAGIARISFFTGFLFIFLVIYLKNNWRTITIHIVCSIGILTCNADEHMIHS